MTTQLKIDRRKLLAGTSALGAALAARSFTVPEAYARQNDGVQFEGDIIISIAATNIPVEAQDALAAAYNAVQPNVNVIWELPGTAESYATWLSTQLAADAVRPDIVSGNYAANFRDYYDFNQARHVENPYTGNVWNDDLDFDFFVARMYQNSRGMVPTRAVHTMWYYNATLFEQAGAAVPTTWVEFVAGCEALDAAGITPISATLRIPLTEWFVGYYMDQYIIDWVEIVRAQEGDWNYDPAFDGEFTFDPTNPDIHKSYTFNTQRFFAALRDGVISYDTPEAAEVVRNFGLVFPRYANSDLFVATEPYPLFLQQGAAMYFNTTAGLTSLYNDVPALDAPFEWGYFNNVPMEGELVKGPVRCSESATGEYISLIQKDQAQVDRGLDFLMFWLSSAGYQPYLDAAYASPTGYAPGGPLRVKGVQDAEGIDELFNAVEFIGHGSTTQNSFHVVVGDHPSFRQAATDIFVSALQGEITPEEFATRVQANIMDNFDEILEYSNLTTDDLDNPARQPGS